MYSGPIILIGFMGAGKTTIGQLLGQITGLPVIDTDITIVEQEKRTINTIFNQHGEEYFRNVESRVLRQVVNENAVITTGGGIILRAENRQLLKETGSTFFLECEPNVVVERLAEDDTRPLLKNKSLAEITQMYHNRLPLYKECATCTIDTSTLTMEEVTELILKRMK
ncbi:MAG TPA: shikimate kinase [Bacillaceae bacterium]|nr:shikimate kinase [Paenibacillus bovis]HLU22196.1 shikimate kinase [Bacillaceae bacterium]